MEPFEEYIFERNHREYGDGPLMTVRTYKYRLYPDREQRRRLRKTLVLCKNLYNVALDQRRTSWASDRQKVSYRDQANELKDVKSKHPEYRLVHSQVLQDVLRRLDKSFRIFFKTKHGYPRFKSKRAYSSIIYPQSGFGIVDGRLRLSKIGNIRIVLHRELAGEVKTLTVKATADGNWFAYFTVELADVSEPSYSPKAPVGIDMGLKAFLTLSTGEKISNPRWYRKSQQRLKRAQRRLARKKKGSKRRMKQRIKVARLYRKVNDQRNDFQHKMSKFLVSKFDCIVVEDLCVKSMVEHSYLSKYILDAGWSGFFDKIAYKAESAGKWFIRVPPHGTTQECSRCGTIVPKALADRHHVCPCCGLSMDRDSNASINILHRGLEALVEVAPIASVRLPSERREFKLVETRPTADSDTGLVRSVREARSHRL